MAQGQSATDTKTQNADGDIVAGFRGLGTSVVTNDRAYNAITVTCSVAAAEDVKQSETRPVTRSV